ncbi:RNA polymerase sigma-70 factor, ECF subfamily [Mucilaginibacter pineti]|uniref:RNA polymerase sigma-70 factor, ECF subfamily n=1 Tax=Mucilaginibacter pineti TaxID=1391627 RepID=A0A1G7ES41_9SPHI|nr:RNA polymerase sigma-70 factor [Mucilaginibacter pineti]SDE66235.1 RNA polymerase sigma-70 factor, ECF subfamily [Mucilaginibacter pineti]
MGKYSAASWTDDILLDLIRLEDDRAAFSELYTRYWDILIDAAFKRLKSRESAEELVQDLFVSFFMRRREINPKSTLEAYLKTALRNQVFRTFHIQQSHQKDLAGLMTRENIQPFMPDELLEAKELKEKIYLIAEKMPEKCREVFIMSRYEQLSHQDIADKLNISVNTVKRHITKALSILKNEVQGHQVDLIAFCVFVSLTAKL